MTEVKFSIYRYLAPADYNLTYNECIQRFARGEAAVLIAGASVPTLIQQEQVRSVVDNLGVAAGREVFLRTTSARAARTSRCRSGCGC